MTVIYPYEISYAGVELPFCNVNYSGRAEYDSTGHTLSGYAMTFRGQFTVATNSPDELNAKVETYVAALSRPRRRFTWKAGSDVLWDIGAHDDGAAAHRDARYGPRPRMVSVSRLTGGISARVEFEIEAFIYLCQNYPNPVEEFSWNFAYSFDRSFICTRRIRGVMRVQSPLNAAAQFLPQGAMFPAVLKGFYRESAEHALSADGLTLSWSISDKQCWRTLPRPLTDGHANFRVELVGAEVRKSLVCSFSAAPDTDKSVIYQFILALIQSRFPKLFSKFKERLISLSIDSSEFENRISANVVTSSPLVDILIGKSGADLAATDRGTITAATSARLAFDLFGDIKDVRPNRRPVINDDGSLSWAQEDRGDQFAASDGTSESRGMTGTVGLIPAPTPYFDRCLSTNPSSTDLPTAGGSAVSPGDGQAADYGGDDYNASIQPINGAQTPTTEAGLTSPKVPGEGSPGEGSVGSEAHENYPYLAYSELLTVVQDYNTVLLKVPAAGASDVVQRTAYPTVKICQLGTARRLNYPVEVPAPAFISSSIATNDASSSRAQLASREVRMGVPKRQLDGRSVEYSCSWRYEIILPGVRDLVAEGDATSETAINPRYPGNPMFSDEYYKASVDAGLRLPDAATAKINADGTYRAKTTDRQ